jgi:hypothetical protein
VHELGNEKGLIRDGMVSVIVSSLLLSARSSSQRSGSLSNRSAASSGGAAKIKAAFRQVVAGGGVAGKAPPSLADPSHWRDAETCRAEVYTSSSLGQAVGTVTVEILEPFSAGAMR